jgi:drug/metabolite transporter (DMT)-like permease
MAVLPAASPSPFALPVLNLPDPVRAALWMGGAVTAFAVMITLVRTLTTSLDPLQVVFFRNAFGLLAMIPWMISQRRFLPRTERIGLHVLRAAIGILAMVGWFTTLALLPLAEATALSFTAPIFTSVLAVLILGEVMRIRRWSAILVGLAGALVILRPGFESIEPAALLAIGTALIWGGSTVLIKIMTRTESAGAVATYLVLFSTPLSLVAALFVWQTPTFTQLGLAALLGAGGSIGHVCMTRSLAIADATLVVTFDYLRLPLVALFAYLAFGEVPDGWIWLGGGIIALSGIYIAHRESKLKPSDTVPVTPPTAAVP